MNKHLNKKTFLLVTILFMSLFFNKTYAQWQKVQFLDAAYAGYVTKSGNLLMSDYQFYGDGGIYYSEDNGASWIKALIKDHAYNKFYEYGGYIYALGYGANIARSADEGKSWKLINYSSTLEGIMDSEDVEATVAYAITEHNGKLYVGDFSGGGVIYSEDYGDTWKRTDLESLKYSTDGNGKGSSYPENIYQIVSFNGKLYAFGVYYVFEYNEADDVWTVVRDDSNFMAVSTIFDGTLYCGRSCPNDDPESAFLENTTDFMQWNVMKGPQDLITRNVRVLGSDDKYIYAVTQDRGAFMLDVASNKWYNLCDGYPKLNPDDPAYKGQYMAPTQIFTDAENVYVIIYDFPGSQSKAAGLYKFPKEELNKRTSISEIVIDSDFTIDGQYIKFKDTEAANINLYDISGKQVLNSKLSNCLYIGSLERGIYVIEAEINGKEVRGKFVI